MDITNINELHFLLIMYDDFSQLRGRVPKETWLDEENRTYNIKYKDGFMFTAPKDLVDILHDGAINNKNPIIKNVQPIIN